MAPAVLINGISHRKTVEFKEYRLFCGISHGLFVGFCLGLFQSNLLSEFFRWIYEYRNSLKPKNVPVPYAVGNGVSMEFVTEYILGGTVVYAVDFNNRCTRKPEPDCIWKSLPYCAEHIPEDVTVCFVNDKDYTLEIYFLDILLS